MVLVLGVALFSLAGVGLVLLFVQYGALRHHLAQPSVNATETPGISILKPLCGVDDELWDNLCVFSDLDYPHYEVLLGVKDRTDPAYPLACRAQARWPDLIRVVLQQGEPGFNPKVNQLISLEAAARYDILAISDSNVRVARNYLREIAAHLSDSKVGLVTHPLAAIGERRLGAQMDNLHLTAVIGPGVVAAKHVIRTDFVVAKSLALRRRDLRAFGGFEAIKDVLAEDYVTGRLVLDKLGKQVALATTPIQNVCCHRSIREFILRYARWCVMQRRVVGVGLYCAMLLLNPVVLASAAALLVREQWAWFAWLVCCALKAASEGLSASAMLRGNFAWHSVLIVPLKDFMVAASWFCGLVSSRVNWRGNKFLVLKGTRLVPATSRRAQVLDALGGSARATEA